MGGAGLGWPRPHYFVINYDKVENDMSLQTVIDQVETLTGMKKFISGGVPTAEAYRLMNAAQKWLDRSFESPKSVAKWYKDLSAGEALIKVIGCRAVKRVWINTEASVVTELTKLDWDEYRALYPGKVSDTTQGIPVNYALPVAHFAAGQQATVEGDVSGDLYLEQSVFVDTFTSKVIILGPPADTAYRLSVEGLFYSKTLSAVSDITYWTEVEPEVLAFATIYHIRVGLNDLTGAEVWKNNVIDKLVGIAEDAAVEQTAGVTHLEG